MFRADLEVSPAALAWDAEPFGINESEYLDSPLASGLEEPNGGGRHGVHVSERVSQRFTGTPPPKLKAFPVSS